jgi:hypothetical protein
VSGSSTRPCRRSSLSLLPGARRTASPIPVEGTVEFRAESGCALLAAGGTLFALVWPQGARGKLDPFRVTLADGTVIHDGDTIRGTGGFFPFDDLQALEALPDCSWDPETGETIGEAWTFKHDGVVEVVDR